MLVNITIVTFRKEAQVNGDYNRLDPYAIFQS